MHTYQTSHKQKPRESNSKQREADQKKEIRVISDLPVKRAVGFQVRIESRGSLFALISPPPFCDRQADLQFLLFQIFKTQPFQIFF